jgi:hypothetical protein
MRQGCGGLPVYDVFRTSTGFQQMFSVNHSGFWSLCFVVTFLQKDLFLVWPVSI